MKANELRINNWVYEVDEDFNRLLVQIGVGDLCDIECSIDNEGDYEPIPLTAEWLEKFGFENSSIKDKFYTKNTSLAISIVGNKFRFIQGNFVCQLILRELDYVHQLQNLYFALTGEELTIQEDTK